MREAKSTNEKVWAVPRSDVLLSWLSARRLVGSQGHVPCNWRHHYRRLPSAARKRWLVIMFVGIIFLFQVCRRCRQTTSVECHSMIACVMGRFKKKNLKKVLFVIGVSVSLYVCNIRRRTTTRTRTRIRTRIKRKRNKGSRRSGQFQAKTATICDCVATLCLS